MVVVVVVGSSEGQKTAYGFPYMTASGGREVAEEGKDTGAPAEACLEAWWAGSEGCRWPVGGCMHIHSLEDLGEDHGAQLAEGPCEGPSVACRSVSLVASPCLAAGCGPFEYPVLHVEQRRLRSVSAAMLMGYA